MPKIVVIGTDNIEFLKQIIANETFHQQSAEQGEYFDVPAIEQVVADIADDYAYEPEDLIEDEDLPLVVQLRLPDEIELSPGSTMRKWVDTDIDADDLDQYREQFPEEEYRLVAVYDEIVTVDDSVDQQEVSAEDEIGQLKAEILQLKALITNHENVQ
jgi:hypothetical protein